MNQLLDVGHAAEVVDVQVAGDRVLTISSEEAGARWVVWDAAASKQLAHGNAASGSLAGNRVLIHGNPLELRDAQTGALITTFAGSFTRSGLSVDGSYAWATSAAGLFTWDGAGNPLVGRPGNYAGARVFAAADDLRVALGPQGSNVIEHDSPVVPAQTLSAPFSGSFHAWFFDGDRFLSRIGNTVWIYSKDAVQQNLVSLPATTQFGGAGDHYWLVDNSHSVLVYDVVGPALPVATFPYGSLDKVVPTHDGLAVLPFTLPEIDRITFTPQVTLDIVDVPFTYVRSFGADSGGRWTIGNSHGALWRHGTLAEAGAEEALGCGAVESIRGAQSGRLVVATASGRLLAYDEIGASWNLMANLPFHARDLDLSANGLLLAAQDHDTPFDLSIIDLPGGNVVSTFSLPSVGRFELADSGATVSRTDGACRRIDLADGSGQVYQDGPGQCGGPIACLGPTGMDFVISNGIYQCTTQFYVNNALVAAVPGCALGWLSNDRVLLQTYHYASSTFWLDTANIYDRFGQLVGPSPVTVGPHFPDVMPEVCQIEIVDATRVHVYPEGDVVDFTTGISSWGGSAPNLSSPRRRTVAGSFVADVEGPLVTLHPI